MLNGNLPTGKAVITTGGTDSGKSDSHCRFTVRNEENGDNLLRDAYTNSLQVAADNGIKVITFCSISTNIFGFPIEKAAPIAMKAIGDFVKKDPRIEEVRMIIFPEIKAASKELNSYYSALEAL